MNAGLKAILVRPIRAAGRIMGLDDLRARVDAAGDRTSELLGVGAEISMRQDAQYAALIAQFAALSNRVAALSEQVAALAADQAATRHALQTEHLAIAESVRAEASALSALVRSERAGLVEDLREETDQLDGYLIYHVGRLSEQIAELKAIMAGHTKSA